MIQTLIECRVVVVVVVGKIQVQSSPRPKKKNYIKIMNIFRAPCPTVRPTIISYRFIIKRPVRQM